MHEPSYPQTETDTTTSRNAFNSSDVLQILKSGFDALNDPSKYADLSCGQELIIKSTDLVSLVDPT